MKIDPTHLDGVLVLTPARFADDRGHFSETWNRKVLADHGIEVDFVQDNLSLSRPVGTLRGLHLQTPPQAQAKLVSCLSGTIQDVAVDVRRGSPTFGQWIKVELSAQNGRQLFIPAGFLHGFVTQEPDCLVSYKCSAFYDKASEVSIRFDDPDLGIDWGLSDAPALSEKDAAAGSFADFTSPFVWEGGA